jgi:hypothetical protein
VPVWVNAEPWQSIGLSGSERLSAGPANVWTRRDWPQSVPFQWRAKGCDCIDSRVGRARLPEAKRRKVFTTTDSV